MASSDTFNRLIVGLAQYAAEAEKKEPNPNRNVLQHSLNELALVMKANFPRTLSGVLRLMAEMPIQSWYPGEIPGDFDPEARLLERTTLSCEVIEYLDHITEESDANLGQVSSVHTLNSLLQNRRFRILRDMLKALFLADPDKAQREYVQFRRFLIENPFTTIPDIEEIFFFSNGGVSAQEVAEFYEEAKPLIVRAENGILECWNCPHCGPLYPTSEGLSSIKSSACGRHCPRNQEGWSSRRYVRELLVLKEGIHLRTYIPGIAELALYYWLCNLHQEYPEHMGMPELWPEIDTYDIRIPFRDETWAVDVKDYKDPYQLGTHLTGIPNRGSLRWTRAFFVYPDYREVQRLRYGEIVRRTAEKVRHGEMICSNDAFQGIVIDKLRTLKKGKGK